MDLKDFRQQIDKIDDEILLLFKNRMDVIRQIALYKKEHDIPIQDTTREQEKLAIIEEKAGEELCTFARTLYSTLLELSRLYQKSINCG